MPFRSAFLLVVDCGLVKVVCGQVVPSFVSLAVPLVACGLVVPLAACIGVCKA